MHGGNSKAGPESGTWKHGRFSRHKPDRLAELAATARADPELLNITRLVADAQAVLDDYTEGIKGKRLTARQREEIIGLQQHLAKLIEMEHRRRRDLTDTITAQQGTVLMGLLVALIVEFVPTDRMAEFRARQRDIRPRGLALPVVDVGAVANG